jgi:hypothetical protein
VVLGETMSLLKESGAQSNTNVCISRLMNLSAKRAQALHATLTGTTVSEDIPALTDKHPVKLGHQGYP